ncbi:MULTISPECIES: MarR family winged helix-turn-helix transcriptional regulator [Sodalis]|uniref:MarR family transcriptional regulator n=1 Tax=Sodalis ligni TaxID=2697027 RepID=A0A4R1NGL3_9GAMM|nr:MarR family transcriptional regulator [Sodalis ligni]TCL03280.1 MarR family transcriptional regulator [Sodalis ligni]
MFDKTLFHLMRVVLQEHTARWTSLMPDLTKPQYAVLEALALSPDGLDQATLGQASATTKATLAEMLGRMEARQLIARRADPADSRRRLVQLTEEGRAMLAIARPVAERVSNSLLQTLSAEEREALVQVMAKMRRGIESKAT